MDLIDFSRTINMLDLVRFISQDISNTSSFHTGKFSTGNEESQSVDISFMPAFFEYLFKKVREGWNVHNLCAIPVGTDLLLCVTSSDAGVCAEALSFLVEVLNDCNIFLNQDNHKDMASNEIEGNDEKMEQDISPDLVQVNATMKEMNERIEQFIRYKRSQADANNVLDFCGPPNLSQFCARVDAVLIRKKDSYSHMAVRNVLDRYTSKYKTDKLSPQKKTSPSSNTLQLYSELQSQHLHAAEPQQGDKRTYEVASLETTLKLSTKQQKTL